MPRLPNLTYGDLQFTGKNAEGGMCIVRQAILQPPQKDDKGNFVTVVGVKSLRDNFVQQFEQRFQQEADLLCERLEHTNIINGYKQLRDPDGRLLVVMEWAERTLDKVIDERISQLRNGCRACQGKTGCPQPVPTQCALRHECVFSPGEVLALLQPLCRGVSWVHEKDIVHRDLKAMNILLVKTGEAEGTFSSGIHGIESGAIVIAEAGSKPAIYVVKVADFGTSLDFARRLTTSTPFGAGTLEYLSPEVARKEETTFRSDVYSLGVQTYELLTGTFPFSGLVEVLDAHHRRLTPPAASARNRHVSSSVDRVLMKALQSDQANRYASVDLFIEELEGAFHPPVREGRDLDASVSASGAKRPGRTHWMLGLLAPFVIGAALASRACGPPGPTTKVFEQGAVTAATVASFRASAESVRSGERLRLSWESTGSSSRKVTLVHPEGKRSEVRHSGWAEVVPVATGSYRLVVEDGAARDERQVTIRVEFAGSTMPQATPPTVTLPAPAHGSPPALGPKAPEAFVQPRIDAFSAAPERAPVGTEAIIRWQTADAKEIELVGPFGRERVPSSGSRPFKLPAGQTSIRLLARNGSVTAERPIEVDGTPILSVSLLDRRGAEIGDLLEIGGFGSLKIGSQEINVKPSWPLRPGEEIDVEMLADGAPVNNWKNPGIPLTPGKPVQIRLRIKLPNGAVQDRLIRVTGKQW